MQQYFSRGIKSLVLRHGPPSYDEFDSLVAEPARVALYSPNGAAFAYSTAKETKVLDPETRQEVCTIPEAAADMYFSPLGRFLVTWTRAKKDASSGNWIPNLKIWSSTTGEFLNAYVQVNQGSFRGGWHVQFTADEQFCVQQVGAKQLIVTECTTEDALRSQKTRVGSLSVPAGIEEFGVSPGRNPSVSVFVGASNGKPASIRVYKLPSLAHPVAQRTLFKAESVLCQWNKLGTALLVVAQTDVDSSNKSYYGESTLYLLSVNSGADQRIMLPKEGPVYDVAWSPESDQFGVVYGLMPARTSFFDTRGTETLTLPLAPRNHIKYSPQGKLVIVAGFGNLRGNMDIYDRTQNFAKVGELLATNSSYYDWSPCGKFILTATTSPRMRVDNGVKLWDYRGRLLYVHDDDELYSVGWKPFATPEEAAKASEKINVFDLKPHESALKQPQAKPEAKTQGAYVPPHARLSGAQPRAVRSLYDAAQNAPPGQQFRKPNPAKEPKRSWQQQQQPAEAAAPSNVPVGGAPAPKPEEKQIRSLVKKLRAIDELKQKQANGVPLEATQTQKIDTEKEVIAKLEALGWKNE